MRNIKRLIASALAVMVLSLTLAACAPSEIVSIHQPEDVQVTESDAYAMDFASEMIPLTEAPAVSALLMPAASGTLVKVNQKAEIDYSNTADGYVMIKFLQNTTKNLKVRVTGPKTGNYDYNLKPGGVYEVFPLSDGNGSYTISVFEQIDGNRYANANSVTVDVKLKDEFAPFLRPNQYVNYKADSAAVKKAADLVKDSKEFFDKVSAIYNFVINNLTYDRDFASEVTRGLHAGYVPDVDSVLAKKKGICFDYAALMTAMLRSQNIPTRLVVGYAGKDYHAWIDVYSEKDGWISSAISFDGKTWKLMDPTFASSAANASEKSKNEIMQYIGDGKNYTARYLY